jgi:hypothetical protein
MKAQDCTLRQPRTVVGRRNWDMGPAWWTRSARNRDERAETPFDQRRPPLGQIVSSLKSRLDQRLG